MKKIILLAFLFIVLPPFYSLAFQNEPNNFNGIKWGTHINKLPSMQLKRSRSDPMSSALYKIYTNQGDKIQIGHVNLTFIYTFYKNRLFSTITTIHSLSDFEKIKKALTELHGEGNNHSNKLEIIYDWEGATVPVLVVLKWNKKRVQGYLGYTYMPIREEMMK